MNRHDPDTVYAVFALDEMGGSVLDDMNETFSALTGCEKQHIGKYAAELFSPDHSLHINNTASVCAKKGRSISYLVLDSTASCRLWKVTAVVNGSKLCMQGRAVHSAGKGIIPADPRSTEEFAGAAAAVRTADGLRTEHIYGITAEYAEMLLHSEAAEICMMNGSPSDIYDFMGEELVHLSFLPAMNQNSAHIAVTVNKVHRSAEDISGCTALCTAHIANGDISIGNADAKFMAMLGKGLVTREELAAARGIPCGFLSRRGASVCCIPYGTKDGILIAAAEQRYTIGRCISRGEFLTQSEYTVMMLAADGMTDKAIAFSMKTHESTVKKLIRRCSSKLGAENRVEMSARAGVSGRTHPYII